MQLDIAFSALLGSVFLALSAPVGVEAAPVIAGAGLVTLPLERVQSKRDISSEMLYGLHLNRAVKRHARLTGREVPSDAELAQNLHRRQWLPADPYLKDMPKGSADIRRRFYRPDVGIKGDEQWTKLNEAPTTNNALAVGGIGVNIAAATATSAGFSEKALQGQQKGGLNKANTPTTANTIPLDIEANDVGYISPIQIGTPPREFNLLMDSGSADMWVGSEAQCVNANTGGNCGNHTFLGSKSSSTFKASQTAFSVTYGSGAVQGVKIQDTVTIAGLKLEAHDFGLALKESNQFADNSVPFDGLVGLAKSTLSQQKVPTPPESLKDKGLIKEAIVSYRIPRFQDGKNNGQVTFGGIDPSTIDSKTLVTMDNISKTGFWEANMTVAVDGKDLGLAGRSSILDTGTTLIIAPADDATAVHKAIPGAKSDGKGGFTIPCTTTAKVAFTFSGQTYEIDPRDMLFAPVDVNNLQGDCLSGISSGTIGGPTEWLVGDVFLKNVIFATDVTKNQISLAKQAA